MFYDYKYFRLDPADKDSGKLKQKGKRGHKAMNTRCFRYIF